MGVNTCVEPSGLRVTVIAHQWETRPIGSETLIDCALLHAHIHRVRYDICHQSSRHTLQGNVHTIQSTGQAAPVSSTVAALGKYRTPLRGFYVSALHIYIPHSLDWCPQAL